MLKINKQEYINEDLIESIFLYNVNSRPLKGLIETSKEKDEFRDTKLSHKGHSIIVYENDKIFLCYLNPDTYFRRLEALEKSDGFLAIDPRRLFVRRNSIEEVVTAPVESQKRSIRTAKENGFLIDLSGKKRTTHFLFMNSGHIYRIHTAIDFGTR